MDHERRKFKLSTGFKVVLTALISVLISAGTCAAIAKHYLVKQTILNQAETSYLLTNIASEIRLGNHEQALEIADNAIDTCAGTAAGLCKSERLFPKRAAKSWKVLLTYDQIAHVLSNETKTAFGGYQPYTKEQMLADHCEAGICRLVRSHDYIDPKSLMIKPSILGGNDAK